MTTKAQDRRSLLDLHCLHHVFSAPLLVSQRAQTIWAPRCTTASTAFARHARSIADDPRLTVAAQRHANDMLKNGVDGHIGSDGSSPQARIADAGYTRTGYTGEIVYWGTGVLAATPTAALDAWMNSPPHRAIILNCAFTAGGFATAWDGNKMTAVADFARP